MIDIDQLTEWHLLKHTKEKRSAQETWKLAWADTEHISSELSRGIRYFHEQSKEDHNEIALKALRVKCIEIGYIRYGMLRPKYRRD